MSGKQAIGAAVLLVSSVSMAAAQSIAGEWKGGIDTGRGQIPLLLHIAEENGKLSATMDSPDQGAFGLSASAVSLTGRKLKFRVDAVPGSYQGTVNADATKITGTWFQGGAVRLDFVRTAAAPKTAPASDIDGEWTGSIDTGAGKLRVSFHVTNTADGLTATMDSTDQGARGIPVTAVTRDGDFLGIEMKRIDGVFQGTISRDRAAIEGTWTQHASSFRLALERVRDAADLETRRPQNPRKPYPYREEEVSYGNKAQKVTLAATLTIPSGKGPFPAVLLIGGSGPHDRDETLMGHKPFLVLSDYLTRKGIAVLRADGRGVGNSSGSRVAATTADFATDAEAGIAYLKTRSTADPRRIGLIGHSEGAVIASMVAARNHDVAFIVMMAGSGVPGDQVIVEQSRLLSQASGLSHEAVEKNAAIERELFALVEQDKDEAALKEQLRKKMSGIVAEAQVEAQIKALTSPWFRYFLTYDPATALRKVQCPVLALDGEKDLQVSPKQNLPAIRKALEDGGNKHFEVDELPGLNHLFQTARTGTPHEYPEIEETISPVALDKIATWVLQQ